MKKRTSSIKLLSLGMVGIILVTALVGGALALPTCVYALPPALLRARTIGELIITILAGANTAVTATPTVNGIYQACPFTYEELVTNGVLSVDGLTTQEAIDQLGQGNELGRPYNLDTTAFRNLMSQNWQTMVNNNMDTVFRIGDIANTDATYGAIDNIGQIALNVANNGFLALENTVAVISNPGSAVTVGLQNVRDAFINTFGLNIQNGIPITTNTENLATLVPNIGAIGTWREPTTNYPSGYYARADVFPEGVKLARTNIKRYYGGIRTFTWYDTTTNPDTGSFSRNRNNTNVREPYIPVESLSIGTTDYDIYWGPLFATEQECKDYIMGSEVITMPSPDVINNNHGNIGNDGINSPVIDNTQGLEIIPQTEYENFIEDTETNYTNGDYEDNADVLQDLINDNLNTVPQPTQPPIVPDQPSIDPKPSIAPEMQGQVLTGTAPNLTKKFPFCLPFDLVNSFKVLEAEARAPHFEWNMKIDRFDIDETIEIDLEPFTPVAETLRILLLLVFIVGLILLTRHIIGA